MSYQKEVLSAIDGYIRLDTTDYAILINGEWGSGKTHFWKNSLVPLIQKLDKKPLYVSLYGIKNVNEIDRLILTAQFPLLKNGMVEVVSMFSKAALKACKVEISLQELKANLKDCILCFDDLERVECKVGEVLGYINRFSEHENHKVLVFAHDAELEKEDGKYSRIKEKLFRFVYHFTSDADSVIDSIVENIRDGDVRKNLAKNKRLISTIFSGGEKNIRALQTAVDLYVRLWKMSESEDKIRSNAVWTGILTLLLSATIEIKSDASRKETLKGLFDINWMTFGFNKALNGKSDPESEFLDSFIKKYFSRNGVTLPELPSVLRVATMGLWNEHDFLVELKAESGRQIVQPQDSEKLFFGQYWRMTDSEFSQVYDRIINNLKNGEYRKIPELLSLANSLFLYQCRGLLSIDSCQLKDIFFTSFSKIENGMGYEDCNSKYETHRRNADFVSEDYSSVIKYLKAKEQEISDRVIQLDLENIFSALNKDVNEAIGIFREKYATHQCSPILNRLPVDLFLKSIKEMHPKGIVELRDFIASRYDFSNVKDYLSKEYDFLDSLLAGVIEIHKSTVNKNLTSFMLKLLIDTLKDSLRNLSNTPDVTVFPLHDVASSELTNLSDV